MGRLTKACFVVTINLAVFVGVLGCVEAYFRYFYPPQNQDIHEAVLWQVFRPYVMFTTSPGTYTQWHNELTKQSYDANMVTNKLGFADSHEFSLTKPYIKGTNEKVVLFVGGSTGWGFGATANDKTVAARMEYYLNTLQSDKKYTVINMAMGAWNAFQELVGMQLWGDAFDPDWVVVMDGFADAQVGCGYSQGVGNPMYFAIMKSFLDAYLFSKLRPVFYRGWLENQLIRHSVAYRTVTGKEPIEANMKYEETSEDQRAASRQIIPTKMLESRQILEFYVKAEKSMLNVFPNAGYILSTQPTLNEFKGSGFLNIYDAPHDSREHKEAMENRERELELELYLTARRDDTCNVKAMAPSFTYIFVRGAMELERLVDNAREHGRHVEYYNTGLTFPDARADRAPYFIDGGHLSNKGADVLGKFYADKILSSIAPPPASSIPPKPPADDPNDPRISIVSATYGENCGAAPGNATRNIKTACQGLKSCEYVIDFHKLRDPAPGCAKSFSVEYRCGAALLTKEVAGEAGLGTKVQLCDGKD